MFQRIMSHHSNGVYQLNLIGMCILTALFSSQAHAYYSNDYVTLNGFGTMGMSYYDSKANKYTTNGLKTQGPGGPDGAWSGALDSRIGLQAQTSYKDLTGVVQVITSKNNNGNIRPSVEWLNLKYDFVPAFSVRAGRIVLPTYMHTESMYVGYASNWARVPVDAYSLIPITNVDGVEGIFRFTYKKITNNLTLHMGSTKVHHPGGGTTKANSIRGFVNDTTYGDFKLHLGYLGTELDTDLFDKLIAQFTPMLIAMFPKEYASATRLKKQDVRIGSIGMGYDDGKAFGSTEMTWTKGDNLGIMRGLYVHGGYRIGNWSPYAMLTNKRTLQSFIGTNTGINNHTISLGTRWDFMKNTNLKLQYDRVTFQNTAGKDLKPQGSSVTNNVLTLLVDFVF
jgi:hypothetical protein